MLSITQLRHPQSSFQRSLIHGALVLSSLLSTAIAQKEQHRIYTFDGNLANTRFGYGIDNAGDVDKDGIPDIVVGADWGSAIHRAGSVWIYSGFSGKLLHTFVGDGTDDRLGTWVSGAGDVNADGYADVVAGAHLDDNNGSNSGMIRIFSGKDGVVLHSVDGAQAGARFGECVDSGGDVDGDGHTDVIVGAPQDGVAATSKEGSVTVISGKTGAIIWKFYGDTGNDQLGRAVCAIGDINFDGYADFAAGSNIVDNGTIADTGLVRIYSGKDGKVIKDIYGATGDLRIAGFIQAGDLNNDGFPDIFVNSSRDTTGSLYRPGSVTVISGMWIAAGAGQQELFKLYGPISSSNFGHSLGYAGDVNKDGFGDLLVGQPAANASIVGGGITYVYSGKDQTLLYKFDGDSSGDNLGCRVAGAGDINGDGYADFMAGAMWDDNSLTNAGSVTVFSGKKLTLASDSHAFSLAAANTQNLTLDLGTAQANRGYVLLGSMSGTTPGVTLFGVTIPINPDAWTDIVMGYTNTPTFVTSLGTLDATGTGSIQINMGPYNAPSAVGLVLHHACLIYDASGLHTATNPTSLLLTK